VADLLGKESSLFVLSGTAANLLAASSHASAVNAAGGLEAVIGDRSHVFLHSQGSLSRVY